MDITEHINKCINLYVIQFRSPISNDILGIKAAEHHEQGKRSSMEDASALFCDLLPEIKMSKIARMEKLSFSEKNVAFFGVYDGHNGTGTSEFLAKYLHLYVAESYVKVHSNFNSFHCFY